MRGELASVDRRRILEENQEREKSKSIVESLKEYMWKRQSLNHRETPKRWTQGNREVDFMARKA